MIVVRIVVVQQVRIGIGVVMMTVFAAGRPGRAVRMSAAPGLRTVAAFRASRSSRVMRTVAQIAGIALVVNELFAIQFVGEFQLFKRTLVRLRLLVDLVSWLRLIHLQRQLGAGRFLSVFVSSLAVGLFIQTVHRTAQTAGLLVHIWLVDERVHLLRTAVVAQLVQTAAPVLSSMMLLPVMSITCTTVRFIIEFIEVFMMIVLVA